MRPESPCLLLGLMLAAMPPALAGDWHGSAAVSVTGLDYQSSTLRRDYRQQTLDLGLETPSGQGLQASLTNGVVVYQTGSELEERSLALAWRGKSTDGIWLWRAGGIRSEDRQSGLPDQRHDTLLAGLGGWPSPDRLLDIGYSHTRLDNGTTVDQLTPMIGGYFDERYLWVQFRGSLQRFSPSAEGREQAAGAELKLTRWLQPGSALKPQTLQAMVSGGRQLYGVDSDTLSLFAQPYVQTAAAWGGAGWRLGPHADALLLAGGSRSHSHSLADTLDSRFIYLNISTHW